MGLGFDWGRDQHRRDVVLSSAQPKNALLDDGLDILIARPPDFPPGGNGSSLFWGSIGVSETLSAYLR